MKIIHTADWHLGWIFRDFNRRGIVTSRAGEGSRGYVLLVVGDVLDNPNPSAEIHTYGLDIHYQ